MSHHVTHMKDTLNQDGFKTIRILDPPNTQIIAEEPCQQNDDGDCIVFNCPWKKFNTDEAPHMIRASNENKRCLHLTDARRLERDLNNDDLDLNQKPDRIFNLTMNFRYGASINNVKFQYPKTPLYEDPRRVFQTTTIGLGSKQLRTLSSRFRKPCKFMGSC